MVLSTSKSGFKAKTSLTLLELTLNSSQTFTFTCSTADALQEETFC